MPLWCPSPVSIFLKGAGLWLLLPFCCLHSSSMAFSSVLSVNYPLDLIPLDLKLGTKKGTPFYRCASLWIFIVDGIEKGGGAFLPYRLGRSAHFIYPFLNVLQRQFIAASRRNRIAVQRDNHIPAEIVRGNCTWGFVKHITGFLQNTTKLPFLGLSCTHENTSSFDIPCQTTPRPSLFMGLF